MSTSSEALQFSTASDAAQFEALRPAWNALIARANQPHVFRSFDWWHNAWICSAQQHGYGLHIVTGWVGDRLVLIWPLAEQSGVLRMLSSGTLEYRDLIVEPSEHSPRWIDEAWSYIKRSMKADIFLFQNLRLPNEVAKKAALVPNTESIGGGWCSVIRLSHFPNWESYFATLPKSLAADQRRQWKRVWRDLPGTTFRLVDDCQKIRPVFDWIAKHKVAWGTARRKHAVWVTDAGIRNALLASARAGLENKTLLMAELSDGTRTIAAGWGYRCGREFLFHAFAYDATYATYSPSRLFLECVIRQCFDEGIDTFDFMPGEEPYKRIWSTEYIATKSFVGPLNWRGAVLLRLARWSRLDQYSDLAMVRMYRKLPSSVRDLLRRGTREFLVVNDALSLKVPTPPQSREAARGHGDE